MAGVLAASAMLVFAPVSGADAAMRAAGKPKPGGATATSAPTGDSASSGTANATFGIGPATANGIDGRPFLNYTTSPGARTTDHVVVQNYSTKPLTIQLYTADATAGAGGAIGFAARSQPGPDAHKWITFLDGQTSVSLQLKARERRVLPIGIAVPVNATPGDHLAGVLASFTGRVIGKSGQNVDLEQRVALRALFRVSGTIRSQMAIERLKVDYHGTLNPFGAGSATITYVVRNTGNVLLSGKQRLNVTGIFGSTGSRSKLVQLPLMLPGAAFPMRVQVARVWPQLLMHARVTVTPLGVAGASDPKLDPASASTSFWAVPWSLLALLVLLAGMVVLVFLWRRKLNARPAAHAANRVGKPALGEA